MKINDLSKSKIFPVFIISFFLFSLLCLTPRLVAKSGKLKKIYISHIKAVGVSNVIGNRVRSGIRLVIFEGFGNKYEVYDDESIKVLNKQAEKLMAAGCDERSCINKIADYINADEIIFGEIVADGSKLKLNLTSLERKDLDYTTKSMVNLSFFESQLDHFVPEAGRNF